MRKICDLALSRQCQFLPASSKLNSAIQKSVISVPSGASMSGGAIVATTHMRVQEMNLQPLLLRSQLTTCEELS